jgi:hypothetical protein
VDNYQPVCVDDRDAGSWCGSRLREDLPKSVQFKGAREHTAAAIREVDRNGQADHWKGANPADEHPADGRASTAHHLLEVATIRDVERPWRGRFAGQVIASGIEEGYAEQIRANFASVIERLAQLCRIQTAYGRRYCQRTQRREVALDEIIGCLGRQARLRYALGSKTRLAIVNLAPDMPGREKRERQYGQGQSAQHVETLP